MKASSGTPEQHELVKRITKELTEQGRIIEAGWRSMEILVVPPTAPRLQRIEMRKAFFAGAQHLWASMLISADEDPAPTDAEERRMEMIHHELEGFVKELVAEMEQRSR